MSGFQNVEKTIRKAEELGIEPFFVKTIYNRAMKANFKEGAKETKSLDYLNDFISKLASCEIQREEVA